MSREKSVLVVAFLVLKSPRLVASLMLVRPLPEVDPLPTLLQEPPRVVAPPPLTLLLEVPVVPMVLLPVERVMLLGVLVLRLVVLLPTVRETVGAVVLLLTEVELLPTLPEPPRVVAPLPVERVTLLGVLVLRLTLLLVERFT